MNINTASLKAIYKANQCTDLNDVNFAISTLKTIVRDSMNGNYTPAYRRRLNSLEKRKKQLLNK
jgi:hypothetical protein